MSYLSGESLTSRVQATAARTQTRIRKLQERYRSTHPDVIGARRFNKVAHWLGVPAVSASLPLVVDGGERIRNADTHTQALIGGAEVVAGVVLFGIAGGLNRARINRTTQADVQVKRDILAASHQAIYDVANRPPATGDYTTALIDSMEVQLFPKAATASSVQTHLPPADSGGQFGYGRAHHPTIDDQWY